VTKTRMDKIRRSQKIIESYLTIMPQKPPAKKARQNRNISGLRNQLRDTSFASESSGHPTPARSLAPSPSEGDESDLEEDDDDLDLLIHFDSMKTNLAYEEEHPDDIEEDEELVEWEGFGRKDLAEVMVEMFNDSNPGDLDWLPTNLRAERDKKRANMKKKQNEKPKGRYSLTFRL
jgi:hypothetical protein